MRWTPATVAKITALWAEGLSRAEIGRRMGITKNAVVGKVHRLGLPARPSPLKSIIVHKPRPSQAGQKVVPVQRREPSAGDLIGPTLPPLTLPPMALPTLRLVAAVAVHGPRACRWPLGDPRTPGFRFCGDPVSERSYCAAHNAAAYIPTRRQETADAA
jgi:GcrA cell cycle regulator